jgi:hypothetical protein
VLLAFDDRRAVSNAGIAVVAMVAARGSRRRPSGSCAAGAWAAGVGPGRRPVADVDGSGGLARALGASPVRGLVAVEQKDAPAPRDLDVAPLVGQQVVE